METPDRVVGAARAAEDSKAMHVLGRMGMGACAAVWLVIAVPGLQLVLSHAAEATPTGR